MSITNEHVKRAITAAEVREKQGYFARVRTGDQRAASLFARLVAVDLNPSGKTSDFGWLSKQPGETQVDGFAEDAICFGADPADLHNVIDMVNGAGAPGASIGGGVKERRATNNWVRPRPLTAAQLNYLLDGGVETVPVSPVFVVDRGEFMDEGAFLHRFYLAPEGLHREHGLWIDDHPDWEGIAAWLFDVYLTARVAGKTREQARALYVAQIRDSGEWKKSHPNG